MQYLLIILSLIANQVIAEEWFERINLSGLFLGELIAADKDHGDSTYRFPDTNNTYHTFCFPRAMLRVDGVVNESVQTTANFNFAPKTSCCGACAFGRSNDEYRFTKFDKVDEVFANINLREKYKLKTGVHFIPYGDYKRHSIPASFTQLMTQTQAAGATVDYSNSNLSILTSVFSSKPKNNSTTKINNLALGIKYTRENMNLNLGYMYNIGSAVNYLVDNPGSTSNNDQNSLNSGYTKRVAGISVNSTLEINSWQAIIQYTSAMKKFASDDMQWRGNGAKPASILTEIAYKWPSSRAAINYQRSFQAVGVRTKGNSSNYRYGLPLHRIQLDYDFDLFKNVLTGVHVFRDNDYKVTDNGTGTRYLTMLVTLKIIIS